MVPGQFSCFFMIPGCFFHGSRPAFMVFHGSRSVFMVFKIPGQCFMVRGGFLWLFMDPG